MDTIEIKTVGLPACIWICYPSTFVIDVTPHRGAIKNKPLSSKCRVDLGYTNG